MPNVLFKVISRCWKSYIVLQQVLHSLTTAVKIFSAIIIVMWHGMNKQFRKMRDCLYSLVKAKQLSAHGVYKTFGFCSTSNKVWEMWPFSFGCRKKTE